MKNWLKSIFKKPDLQRVSILPKPRTAIEVKQLNITAELIDKAIIAFGWWFTDAVKCGRTQCDIASVSSEYGSAKAIELALDFVAEEFRRNGFTVVKYRKGDIVTDEKDIKLLGDYYLDKTNKFKRMDGCNFSIDYKFILKWDLPEMTIERLRSNFRLDIKVIEC